MMFLQICQTRSDSSFNSLKGNRQDDFQPNMEVITPSQPGDTKTVEQEAALLIGGSLVTVSSVFNGASAVMNLLRILGEGLRLSSIYQCQVKS